MRAALLALAFVAAPAAADPLEDDVRAVLARQGAGTRFGIVVADEAGRELLAIAPDDRFVPASNAKVFTTAAAMATLDTRSPDGGGGATVHLDGTDVVLAGHGDARLSSAADCERNCLQQLADAVAARTRQVSDVIGDDSEFPDERWPAGMSWNNMAARYGTAVSALTLDDNVTGISVQPGPVGAPARASGDGYYRIVNRAVTTAGGTTALDIAHQPGSEEIVLTGTIAADERPRTLVAAIDDPARRAAWRLAMLLRARGVAVTGQVRARHRVAGTSHPPLPAPLARLAPPPLSEDIRLTNKQSHNLHAELLLRRVGRVGGDGSVEAGQAVVDQMMVAAGVERWRYDFGDGSGMSTYDRVSPRAMVRFLRWTQTQRWGAAWRATLPIGAVDGTLRARFVGTALARRVEAKTGTLNGANAISGFITTASGRALTFAAFANDMPQDASATRTLDAALLAVAARY